MSNEFTNIYSSNGIIHQTSCPYTFQQNNVAKRKLCHILDVAHTLMFHAYVPKPYRSDVVLTTCYPIKRMLSPVINNHIPISCLSRDAVLFYITCISGCTSFVHVLGMDLNKLSSCAIKSIFLGILTLKKVIIVTILSLENDM